MASKDYDAKAEFGDSYAGKAKKARLNLLTDPVSVVREILADGEAVRKRFHFHELIPLLKDLAKKGEPLDDKTGTTEKLIEILTLLPPDSQLRTDLTNKLIDTLWDNLQHPPLSYLGGNVRYQTVQEIEAAKKAGVATTKTSSLAPESIQFSSPVDPSIKLVETVPTPPNAILHYRTPDGSYNNILTPDLGRAGTPYAKSVRTEKRLAGVKPDPGLLFDLLMARGDKDSDFKENGAGVSAMLFYHASIIIHDIFRTNRADSNISDTSSYLDLAPLYGSSLAEQLEIRTMERGLLKPDTFSEKRLLGQPPGVNAILVLYSRFHNYVADVLLKINENDRFKLMVGENAPPIERAKAVAKQDHDLFNTARLIVNGLYINICLHDYLRAITNTHSSDSNWTLDPRVEIDKHFDQDGTPRGIGNQVSAEFNLLYRFHSCISKRDEKWTNKFFTDKIFPGMTVEQINKLPESELMAGLGKYAATIPAQPEKREFDGCARGPDGRFRDEDLARCLEASMNDPAGVFGARQVPKILRVVETLGIVQARKWQVASLNEFRDFFGLKRHMKFSDINSDPEIANILERLYSHPDMVELYPGLMIEDAKPISYGCGISPTYSVGRAILSDAITLVRSDRFNTIDYTVSNLTAWGYNEVQQNYDTLGGSMFYKLIQRGLPNWFPYNSLNVMQPMYTKDANRRIATKIKTIKLYTEDGVAPPRPVTVLTKHDDCKAVLKDHKTFVVPWLKAINDLFPGERDFSWYMLSADGAANLANRHMSEKILYGAMPELIPTVKKFVDQWGRDWIEKGGFKFSENFYEIDILRDVVIPLNARLLADLFYFDLRTQDENPRGSLSYAEVYQHLLNIRVWGANNNDPAQAWNRRRWARESAKVIIDTTRPLVQEVESEMSGGGIFTFLSSFVSPNGSHGSKIKNGSLRSLGRKLVRGYLENGVKVEQTIDNLWLNGFGAVGTLVTMFAECMEFFLKPENVTHWSHVQTMASKNDDGGIREYVLEAQRLTTRGRNMRIATQTKKVGETTIAAGTAVVLMLGNAGRDPTHLSEAGIFKPERRRTGAGNQPMEPFSDGIHHCFGREIALTFVCGMIKLVAGLKNLRPAPGPAGQLKSITLGTEKCFLNDNWSYLTFDPSTWKLHYDGHGKGTYKPAKHRTETNLTLPQIEYQIGAWIEPEKHLV